MHLGAQDYIMKGNLSRLCPAIARELEDAKVRNNKKHTEEKLRYEEERFRAFAENSSDIIVVVNREGIITYENPAVERILGLKLEERIGAGRSENLHLDDMEHVTDSFNTLFGNKNAPAQKSEVRLRHRDGSWRNFEAIASHLVHDNVVEAIIINLRDITERKRAEEALLQESNFSRAAFDSLTALFFMYDDQGRFIKWNEYFKIITGYSDGELSRMTPLDVVVENERAFLQRTMETVSTTKHVSAELSIVCKDGSVKPHFLTGNLIEFENKQCVIGMGIDITERKKAEEMLLLIKQAVEGSSDAIGIADAQGNHFYQNKAFTDLLGYTSEELAVSGVPQTVYADKDVARNVFETIMKGGSWTGEVEDIAKNGRRVTVMLRADAIKDESDKIIGLLAINTDITERKKMEETLLLIKKAVESSSDAIGMSDPQGNHFYQNKACTELFEYTLEEIKAAGGGSVLYANKDIARRVFNAIMSGKSWSGEVEMISKSGCKFPVIVRADAIKDEGGKIVGLIGVHTDITERKRAEEEISKLASVVQFSSELVNLATPDGKMIFLNESGSKMLGIDPDKVGDYSIKDIIPEPFIAIVRQELIPTLMAGNNWEGELQYRNIKTGMLTDVHAMTFIIKDSSTGRPIYLANVSRDITEHKKAEKLLKQSEAKYRLLADHVKDLVWLMDLSLKVTHISPSVEKLLGYTLEELIQLPLDKLLTATSLQTAMEFYSVEMPKALKAPAIYSLRRLLELECCCKDGTILWIECVFSFIRDKNGKPLSIMGEGRDITERKQMEYDLRASEINFRHSLDDSPLGVRVVTIEGETIYANRAILDMYGYDSIEELKKISLKERYTPESYTEFLMRKEKRLRGELGPTEYEISIVRKNGEIRHLYVFRKEIFWNGKKQSQVIYQNITLRRQAEGKLRETLESLRKSIKTTIQVLGTASEARDPYTAGHQKRVADLACAIAVEMGLPHDKIEGIRMAGSIHDIGKLSVPAEILVKPTKLTNIEFSLIKEHPQIGYEMLKNIESPWPLAQIVYQHHERINGSGYPRNLKGDDILMEARIMAVADVVEAMSSHRPYRPGLGIEVALEEIEKNKGLFYDNAVVDTCLRLFREKGYQLK
jgi:PAS domain S-box-containing protein